MAKKTFTSKFTDIVYKVLDEYWLDDDTYVIIFNDMIDADGDPYHLEVEYHKDEKRVTFVRVYDYENMDAINYIAPRVRKEIEEYILRQVGLVHGMLSEQKIAIELSLDIDPQMTLRELHEYLENLKIRIAADDNDKAKVIKFKNLGWTK